MTPNEKNIESTPEVEPPLGKQNEATVTRLGGNKRVEPEAIPDVGDRWEITEMLGEGGMSVVYKARHKVMGRLVAVKLLHKHLVYQGNNLQRFQQESIAAGNINHDNVINVLDCGITENQQPFLIMDYLPGKSLAQEIASTGQLPAERAWRIFKQICSGMQAAHSKGIVHRDLKPSNIMLVEEKSRKDFVKIVDFGIAKLLPQEDDRSKRHQLTQTGEVFGSPLYMSPEQCSGQQPDVRSDIYSLGCLMYETLAGRPPLMGASYVETMFMQLNDTPASLSKKNGFNSLLCRLEQIIFKSIAKDPADRYQSMSELDLDLDVAKKGWLAWLLRGRALRDLPLIWKKANQRQIIFVNLLLIIAFAMAVFFAVPLWRAYELQPIQAVRQATNNLDWWPNPKPTLFHGSDFDRSVKYKNFCQLLLLKKFRRRDVGADRDYVDALCEETWLHANALDYATALQRLKELDDPAVEARVPLKELHETDPAAAQEKEREVRLLSSMCRYLLQPDSMKEAGNCYNTLRTEILEHGRKSRYFPAWVEAGGKLADSIRMAPSAASPPEVLQAERIYQEIIRINSANDPDKAEQGNPETTAKCLLGRALLCEKYGLIEEAKDGLPKESAEQLFQRAISQAKLVANPRGKKILARIRIDYADFVEKSDWVQAWNIRHELVEEFSK